MKLRQFHSYESVELVEEKFKFWQFLLIKVRHVEDLSNSHKRFEGYLLVSEDEEEEASHKVHALAVFDFWIEERISFQDVLEYLWLDNVSHIME